MKKIKKRNHESNKGIYCEKQKKNSTLTRSSRQFYKAHHWQQANPAEPDNTYNRIIKASVLRLTEADLVSSHTLRNLVFARLHTSDAKTVN